MLSGISEQSAVFRILQSRIRSPPDGNGDTFPVRRCSRALREVRPSSGVRAANFEHRESDLRRAVRHRSQLACGGTWLTHITSTDVVLRNAAAQRSSCA